MSSSRAKDLAAWRKYSQPSVTTPGRSAQLRDEIDYALPLGPVGQLAARLFVDRRLARLFAYRHETTEEAVLAGGLAFRD
ncbi:MAG: hypothetical protein OXR73_31735 [Myxococcales bacterium]|nr:hypothetical protein [Myxococcales bacterium]